MRYLSMVTIACVLAGPVGSASEEAEQVRMEVLKCGKEDDEFGAAKLCLAISVAATKANAAGGAMPVKREWEDVLFHAQEQLGKMRSPETAKVSVRALRGLPTNGRIVVLKALEAHDPSDEIERAAMTALGKSGDFREIVAGIDILGTHRVERAVPQILKHLKKSSWLAVQIAACRALGRIQVKESVSHLIHYLKQWRSGRMRFEATAALRATRFAEKSYA